MSTDNGKPTDPASQAITPRRPAFTPDIETEDQLRDTLQDVLQTISDALHYGHDPSLQGKMLRSLLTRVPALRVVQPLMALSADDGAPFLVMHDRRGAEPGEVGGFQIIVRPIIRQPGGAGTA